MPFVENIAGELVRHRKKTYQKRAEPVVGVVIHHSKASNGPRAIARTHANERRWAGIGYAIVIFEGFAYQTQPLDLATYHAGKHNDSRVGICFVGDFDSHLLLPDDRRLGARVIARILDFYQCPPAAETVGPWWNPCPVVAPHRSLRWASKKVKSCPGDLFPMGALIRDIEQYRAGLAPSTDSGIVFPSY